MGRNLRVANATIQDDSAPLLWYSGTTRSTRSRKARSRSPTATSTRGGQGPIDARTRKMDVLADFSGRGDCHLRKQSVLHGLVFHEVIDHRSSGEMRFTHFKSTAQLSQSIAGSLEQIAQTIRTEHPDYSVQIRGLAGGLKKARGVVKPVLHVRLNT